MRIAGGEEPLHNTGVHPESYKAARLLLEKTGQEKTFGKGGAVFLIRDYKKMAQELEVGEPTLRDIVKRSDKSGQGSQSRYAGAHPALRCPGMKDLKEGMVLKGTGPQCH